MTDLEPILPLWRELEASGADYVLATIVAVEGSSYRKPGAHMLLTQDGRRAGTVSGGCLEAEVARKAWWLTASGPVIERYSTLADDGDLPYGSGCGGVVYILLERRTTARPLLEALVTAFEKRQPLAIATVLEGQQIGHRVLMGRDGMAVGSQQQGDDALADLARLAMERHAGLEDRAQLNGAEVRVPVDYLAARPGLWIFSAGDDAKPLANMAREMGWYVAVADGRAHLATRGRFPAAHDVRVLPIADLPGAAHAHLTLLPTDAAVVMTHSFEQDSRILASLLGVGFPLAYIGVLGPQRRTLDLLAEAARLLGLPATSDRLERWMDALHAPTGLDLGGEAPAAVALSILAEVQQAISAATGQPLRKVRATAATVSA